MTNAELKKEQEDAERTAKAALETSQLAINIDPEQAISYAHLSIGAKLATLICEIALRLPEPQGLPVIPDIPAQGAEADKES